MSIYLNNRPLAPLVYMVSSLDGHLAPTVVSPEAVALANAPGLWTTQVKVQPRTVTVGLDVRPHSFSGRQTLMDTLKRRLGGLLELRTDDLPGRVLRCVLSNVAVELYTGAHAQPEVFVTLTFTAVDPARHDVEPLLYGLSTARTACPVGTDTSAPDVWVYGACTNPEVVIRSHTGAEVLRMTLAVTLDANDAMLIEAGPQRITRYVAGVVQTGASAGLAAFASGRFPLLSPEDASPDGDAWPTVELASSAGTPTGLIRYTRRW